MPNMNVQTINTPQIVLSILAALSAMLVGLSLGLSIYPVVIFLIISIIGIGLIAYPNFGIWVVIVGTLVISGLADLYAPFLKPIVWGLVLLSATIAFIAIIKMIFDSSKTHAGISNGLLVSYLAVFFVIFSVISSVVNWHGFSAFAVGLKGYFQVWTLLVALFYFTKTERSASHLIKLFLILGLLQLPFVFHQFFVLIPKRSSDLFAAHGIVAGDIVAGTFGGSMMGGGRSSTLALLAVFCITIVLAQLRSGQTRVTHAVLPLLIFLLPMFLSEAKIFLVLLPMALFFLFRDLILKNLVKAFVYVFLLCTLLSMIFYAYSLLPGATSQRSTSIQKMIEQNESYNLGNKGYGNGVLNRLTVYPFWLKEHAHADAIVTAILGHGPGSTSSSALNDKSLASKRYPGYGIGLTGLSSLLWEVGLLGTITVLMMLTSAYQLGGRVAQRWENTIHWPLAKAAQISMPLFAFNLLHNNYFVFDLSFQAMLIVILGYLLVMTKFEKQAL